MFTRQAAVVLGCVAFCSFAATSRVAADPGFGPSRAEGFTSFDAALLIQRPQSTGFDGQLFPVANANSAFQLAAFNMLPISYLPGEVPRTTSRRSLPETNSNVPEVDLRQRTYDFGGEVGAYYGKSTGKYGGEQFGTYVFGTVGNEKFQITAGASYQESNFRFPPRGR